MTKIPTNVFIIGVHRAATTSLFRYLSNHPQINPSKKKEPHYFTSGIYSGSYTFDRTNYDQLYPTINGVKLEASPSYFYGGKKLAQVINKSFSDPRFLLTLRNPSDRFLSFYRHFTSEIKPSNRISIEQFFLNSVEEYENGTIEDNHTNRAIREGIYADYITPWIINGKQKFKLIDFEDIESNLGKVLKETYHFLGLPPLQEHTSKLLVHNESREIKSHSINWLAVKVNSFMEPYFARNTTIKGWIKNTYKQLNEKESTNDISDSFIKSLSAYYSPHNKRLKELLVAHSFSIPKWLDNL